MGSKITFDLVGAEQLDVKLRLMRTKVSVQTRKVIAKRALLIRAQVMRKLSQPGTGNKYKRGSKWHTASRPGSPPAPDTGRYRGSIAMTYFAGGLAAEVGTKLTPYPGYLEPPPIGDERGLSNRPALTPVWEVQRALYVADMQRVVRELGKG